MKVYDTNEIRNLAIVGHGDSGKTSLVSAMLLPVVSPLESPAPLASERTSMVVADPLPLPGAPHAQPSATATHEIILIRWRDIMRRPYRIELPTRPLRLQHRGHSAQWLVH